MKQKFLFLCGNFEKINCIYAIKFTKQPWHYFEEVDSVSAVHDSLPPNVDVLISTLHKVRTIEVLLDEEQTKNYYNNGKLIFKGKELKTCKPFRVLLLLQRSYLMYFSSAIIQSVSILQVKVQRHKSIGFYHWTNESIVFLGRIRKMP